MLGGDVVYFRRRSSGLRICAIVRAPVCVRLCVPLYVSPLLYRRPVAPRPMAEGTQLALRVKGPNLPRERRVNISGRTDGRTVSLTTCIHCMFMAEYV